MTSKNIWSSYFPTKYMYGWFKKLSLSLTTFRSKKLGLNFSLWGLLEALIMYSMASQSRLLIKIWNEWANHNLLQSTRKTNAVIKNSYLTRHNHKNGIISLLTFLGLGFYKHFDQWVSRFCMQWERIVKRFNDRTSVHIWLHQTLTSSMEIPL